MSDMKRLLEAVDRMSHAEKKPTGPKFPGYWQGTDPASRARSKMVGSAEGKNSMLKDLDRHAKDTKVERRLREEFQAFKQDNEINPTDTVKMDVPLLLRVLEYAKEDAKTDMDLHDVTTNLIELSRGGRTLNMQDYAKIVAGAATTKDLDEDLKQNRLHYKKLNSEEELIEHAKKFSAALHLDGVPVSHRNRFYTVCSYIMHNAKESLQESQHIRSGRELIRTLTEMDQFQNLNLDVGSKVAIINAQLQGDSAELWGFTTPKTITKIFRESSDHSIVQFQFNNDPNDVWPRVENAEYQGQHLMYSAFFGNKNSADSALLMLTLSNEMDLRNHVVSEGHAADKKSIVEYGTIAPQSPSTGTSGLAAQNKAATQQDQDKNTVDNAAQQELAVGATTASKLKSINPTIQPQQVAQALKKTDTGQTMSAGEIKASRDITATIEPLMTNPRFANQLAALVQQANTAERQRK